MVSAHPRAVPTGCCYLLPSEASPKAPAGPARSLGAAGHVKNLAGIISEQTHGYLPAPSRLLPSCVRTSNPS